VKFLKLWKEMLDKDPNFETIAVANAPGVNSTALRIAVHMLQGHELDESKLSGQFGHQIVIPIPVVITPENFDEMYNTYVVDGNFPDSYLMSGIMTDDEVLQFFKN
jgi:ribose transport system substrate-binding protein